MRYSNKAQLRAQFIAQRAALSKTTVTNKSTTLMRQLRSLNAWKTANTILAYWPIRNEVDIRPLIKESWEKKIHILLPRCHPDSFGEMDIAYATSEADLTEGMFSIREPHPEKCPAANTCCPDIALIPAVCFDRHGFRLGYGGGYYDRLLGQKNMEKTLKIGIGFSFQLIDRIPNEDWDIPVNIVCTEEEVWRL